jgi:hypothetical protein
MGVALHIIKNFNREKKGAGGLTTTEGSPDRERHKNPTCIREVGVKNIIFFVFLIPQTF